MWRTWEYPQLAGLLPVRLANFGLLAPRTAPRVESEACMFSHCTLCRYGDLYNVIAVHSDPAPATGGVGYTDPPSLEDCFLDLSAQVPTTDRALIDKAQGFQIG